MKAQESDLVSRDGLYPAGMRHVFVLAKEKYSNSYRWTSGRPTGETDSNNEHFEIVTDSPLVEPDKAMYHSEDIINPERKDITELNS